ncbi:MAG: M50 family metallopeptidase [Actinomycetota bacterium]|nr:M50 family metallopeptidase [Actinomycetota bacterium]
MAASLWHTAVDRGPAPPPWVVALSLVVAAVVVGFPRAWRLSRNVITIAHEGGHAVVGLLAGRRLAGIRLHSDTSGVTVTSGRPRGVGMVATVAAGYVMPSLLGLGGAWLVASRHMGALLVGSLALLAAMLMALRNVFGVLSVAVCAAAILGTLWLGSATLQATLAWTMTWLLLLGGVRPVWELQRTRGSRSRSTSDADQLAALTHLPAVVWVAVFAGLTLASLFVGARWLVLTVR